MLQRKWQKAYTSFTEKYRMYLLIGGKNRGLAGGFTAVKKQWSMTGDQ
jgi:hypothetical protein